MFLSFNEKENQKNIDSNLFLNIMNNTLYMLIEEPLSLLSVELESGTLTKVSKVRTGGSHFIFNNKTSIHNCESDRSVNPATQHLSFYDFFRIYEKIEMLRCRLKRRARFAQANSPTVPSFPNLVTNYWTHFYAAFTSNCTGLTKSNDE